MSVPAPPMVKPTTWKIHATPQDVAPMLFKMAISLVLSSTIMVRLATMLNAATITISVRNTSNAIFCKVNAVNNNLFTALTLQKIALLVFLTLIVIVAAFNMVASLTMMVLDKTKEIAILKSMGATSWGVAWIFQVVGLTIGGAGTLIGLGFGLTLCAVMVRYGYPLDPKV